MSDVLKLDYDGPVATITLDRPAKHNMLEIADMGAFMVLLDEIDAREEIRVTILTGAGERSFSAGVDLGEVRETDWSDNPLEHLCDRMEAMAMPVVSALNGNVYGGACDLALACDFRIGVEGMKLVMPPARLGVIYHETGLRRFVERLGPQVARRLFLASETMEAAELYRIGFLDRVVARGDFPRQVEALAEELAGMSPLAVRGMKRAINEISRGTLDSARLKRETLACFASDDLAEGLAASRQKRKPSFKGN
jgi:enoyl-CoA hydratase/carnithine racemase